jgi:hypothetical protein
MNRARKLRESWKHKEMQESWKHKEMQRDAIQIQQRYVGNKEKKNAKEILKKKNRCTSKRRWHML